MTAEAMLGEDTNSAQDDAESQKRKVQSCIRMQQNRPHCMYTDGHPCKELGRPPAGQSHFLLKTGGQKYEREVPEPS